MEGSVSINILRIFGYQQTTDIRMWDMMLLSLIFFVKLVLFSGIIYDDIATSRINYIFIRTKKIVLWYVDKCMIIILCSLSFDLFLYLTFFTVLHIFGYETDKLKILFILLKSLLFCKGITGIGYLLAANILTIQFNLSQVYLLVWLFHTPLYIVSVKLMPVFGKWIVFFSPPLQGIINLHEIPVLASAFPEMFSRSIRGFSVEYSAVFMIFLCLIVSICGYFSVKKFDFKYR
jgi:hypothetical protein